MKLTLFEQVDEIWNLSGKKERKMSFGMTKVYLAQTLVVAGHCKYPSFSCSGFQAQDIESLTRTLPIDQ